MDGVRACSELSLMGTLALNSKNRKQNLRGSTARCSVTENASDKRGNKAIYHKISALKNALKKITASKFVQQTWFIKKYFIDDI